MRRILIGLILISLIFFYDAEIYAHGTGYRRSNLQAIPLEFFYSTGEKMSYCEIKVFSPDDSKFAIQSGRTDEQGRFAFIPDAVGEWRVIARDEEGHQCEAKINIESLNNISVDSNDVLKGYELAVRALLGVSLIFNIALLIRRRNNAHK